MVLSELRNCLRLGSIIPSPNILEISNHNSIALASSTHNSCIGSLHSVPAVAVSYSRLHHRSHEARIKSR